MERAEMGIYRILLRVSLRALHGLGVDCLSERLQIKNNIQYNPVKISVYKIHTRGPVQTNTEFFGDSKSRLGIENSTKQMQAERRVGN